MVITKLFNATRLTTGYLRHQLVSGNEHDAHSPFLYQLLTEGIYKKEDPGIFQNIENFRKALLRDDTIIAVSDLGAGSSYDHKKIARPVREIASNFAKSPQFCRLLFRLSRYFKPQNIVELGTSLGISTMYLALGNPNAKIITLEGCPETAACARNNFTKMNCSSVTCLTGDFDTTLPEILNTVPADFIFIDGNHTYEATMRYFNWILPKVHAKTVIIFDDINWSAGMQQAWLEIQQHPKVTQSLDFYLVGITFFDQNLSKQHFKLRF